MVQDTLPIPHSFYRALLFQEKPKFPVLSSEERAYRTSLDAVTNIITCRMKQRGPTSIDSGEWITEQLDYTARAFQCMWISVQLYYSVSLVFKLPK